MPAPLTSGIRRALLNSRATGDGFLPAPITQDDADTHGWWRADSYITPNSYVGDRLNATSDKTSAVAPNFNLQIQASATSYILSPNYTDNDCNWIVGSENNALVFWLTAACTKNTATTCTFLATGGRIYQSIYHLETGKSYTFKFSIRAITGNTNLKVRHNGSATGATTAIAINGTLTEYSVTFLGPATSGGATIEVGIQDDNVAGFGQIELTRCSLYRSDHSGNYVLTTGVPKHGKRNGVPVFSSTGLNTANKGYWGCTASRTNNYPMTLYLSVYFSRTNANGYFATANTPTLLGAILEHNITGSPSPRVGLYTGAPTSQWRYGSVQVPVGQWAIVTAVWNGASSEIRVNKNAASVVNPGGTGPGCDRWQFGGDSYVGNWVFADFHEIISRYVVDNTATQNQFIDYMASRVGLTV